MRKSGGSEGYREAKLHAVAKMVDRGKAYGQPGEGKLWRGQQTRAHSTDVFDESCAVVSTSSELAQSERSRRRRRKSQLASAVWLPTVLLAYCLLLNVARGQAGVPYGFKDQRIAGGFQLPVDFAFFPGDDRNRFLVAEKEGQVKLVAGGSVQATPVLDISSRVNSYLDRGLISVLVDRDFYKGKPFVYLAYAARGSNPASRPKVGQIARVKLNDSGTRMVSGSLRVLVGKVIANGCRDVDLTRDVICCDSSTHCVGGLDQSQDGIIWASIGDGAIPQVTTDGKALRAQRKNILNGKLLRITRSGKGAPDNPSYSGAGNMNKDKIFAYGLRNGWRIHLDELSRGALVADVGWASFESIKLARSNYNLKWPCEQGPQKNAAYSIYAACGRKFPLAGTPRAPVEFYGRRVGVAVSSAIRIPFSSWPSRYRKKVFYTDYGKGVMRFFGMDARGKKTSNAAQFAQGLNGPVQLRLGPGQRLYYLALHGQEVRAISWSPDRSAPKILTVSPPNDAIGIEKTTTVNVVMNKLVATSSLSGSIVMKRGGPDGARVRGTIKQNRFDRIIIFKPDEELNANARYWVRIGGLKDNDGRALNSAMVVKFRTGTGRTLYISELRWTSQTNALGPVERDQSNGLAKKNDGLPIAISGIRFEKGLGCVADSKVKLELPVGCTRFQATVGIDDAALDLEGSRAHFAVFRGSRRVFYSRDARGGAMTTVSAPLDIDIDVTGGGTSMTLETTNGGTPRPLQSLSSWGAARLRCGDFDRTKPRVTKVIPNPGALRIPTSTTVTIRFSEAMDSRFLPSAVRIRTAPTASAPNPREVGWSPSLNTGSTQLTMMLEELAHNTKYVVIVGQEARDMVGNQLKEEWRSTFTTKPPPATGSLISLLDLRPQEAGGGSANFRPNAPVEIMDPANTAYRRGLGMETWSRVAYKVPKGCSVLRGLAGVDAASARRSKCKMEVFGWTTRKTLFTEVFKQREGTADINIDVSKENEVRLAAIPEARSPSPFLCNWANLRFLCGRRTVFLSSLRPNRRWGKRTMMNRNAKRGEISFSNGGDETTRSFANGIVMKPLKTLTYRIPWSCSRLTATFGLDPRAGTGASMAFSVDGPRFGECRTKRFMQGSTAQQVSCNIRGSTVVKVQAQKGGDTVGGDIGVVGLPQLDCAVGSRKPKAVIRRLPGSFVIGDVIQFSGTGRDYRGRELGRNSYTWTVTQHHCAPLCHRHPIFSRRGAKQGRITVDPHGDYFYYEITLQICDPPSSVSLNTCAYASANIYPKTADLTVETDPTGLLIGVDNANGQAPLRQTVVVGSLVELSTLRTQGIYSFQKWSHNGARTPITKVRIRGSSSRRFVARFQA